MRRWVWAALGLLGLLLVATSALVWTSAEQALGAAPEVRTSPRGGLSSCAVERAGQLNCDPPELPGGTVAVIVVLAVVGSAALAAAVVGLLRQRRLRG